MKRRQFIKSTAVATAGAAVAPAFLKGKPIFSTVPNDRILNNENDNIMIILELFGGNDGLNTIVPVYNDTYYNLRPTLAYPEAETRRFQTSDVYMNKSIVDGIHNGGMMRLLEDGRLAIIEGVGYVNPNLSHFRSQDIWLSGINNSNNSVNLNEGWLGRYFANMLENYPQEIPEDPIAVNIDGSLSLTFKSSKGHMGIALTDPDKFYELGQGLTPVEPIMAGDSAFANEFNFARVIAQQSELYSQKVKAAYDAGIEKIKVNYSEGLPQKFKMISALIAGGLQSKVYYVNLSNFDSHAQQMTEDFEGQHPTLLQQAAAAISEFMDDAVQQGWSERVVGMTTSEFGRRAYDNGSRGTDHGAASMQFVFGDHVKAGYWGEKPNLDDLDEDGDVRHQFDYRRTYVDFLETWLGADPQESVAVFGEQYMPIGVLEPRDVSVNDPVAGGKSGLKVYPSPSPTGDGTVSFELREASNVSISVHDLLGYKVLDIKNGSMNAGIYNMPFRINKSGSYIIRMTANKRSYSGKFVVIR